MKKFIEKDIRFSFGLAFILFVCVAALSARATTIGLFEKAAAAILAKLNDKTLSNVAEARKQLSDALKKEYPYLKPDSDGFNRIISIALKEAIIDEAQASADRDVVIPIDEPAKKLAEEFKKEYAKALAEDIAKGVGVTLRSGADGKMLADLSKLTLDNNAPIFDAANHAPLRDAGFAVTMGYGFVPDEGEGTVSLQVRYNLLHSPVNRYYKADSSTRATMELEKRIWPEYIPEFIGSPKYLTGFYIWGGYGADQIKLSSGTGSRRAILAGVSLGLGRAVENASAIHLDVGYTFMDGMKFGPDNHLYFGVSVDAILFRAITRLLTDTFPVEEATQR